MCALLWRVIRNRDTEAKETETEIQNDERNNAYEIKTELELGTMNWKIGTKSHATRCINDH
jgi:hypothetical protein